MKRPVNSAIIPTAKEWIAAQFVLKMLEKYGPSLNSNPIAEEEEETEEK